ncbi:MAG TPA: TolC family protein [Treponemataceae bacterium]|nr:TolC family protein [Treponemataceae bacterium]
MKKRIGIVLFLLAFTLCFGQIQDLRQILESVKEKNPDYVSAVISAQTAFAEVQADRREKIFSGSVTAQGGVQGTAFSDPVITPAAGAGINAGFQAPAGAKIQAGSDYSVSFGENIKTDNLGISASASIPVFVNGKFIDQSLTEAAVFVSIEAPYVQAKTAAEKRQLSVLDAVLRLALDAESLSRKLQLAQRRLVLAEKEAEIAKIQWESGNTGFSVFDSAQKACDEVRISVQELQYLFNLYSVRLSSATGIEGIDISGLTVPPHIGPEELRKISGTPSDIQLSELQVTAARMNSVLTGAQYAPVLSLSGRAGFPNTFVKTDGLNSDPSWSASLSVSIPLPAGAQKLRKEAALLKQEAAVQEELSARQNSTQQGQSLMDEYETSCERERLRSQILAQTKTRYKEVERAYETETATALDKDRAFLSVLEAESALKDEGISRFKAALSVYTYFGMNPEDLFGIKHTGETHEER